MPKRVLVIDAIATHRIRFAALLETANYFVQTAASPKHVDVSLSDFDVILVGLPDQRPGHLVASVAQALEGASTPILCMDTNGTPLRRLLALRSGAQDVLRSKSPDDLVLALVRRLIRQGEAERESERRRQTAASFGFSEPAQHFHACAKIGMLGDFGETPDQLAAVLDHDVVALPDLRILDEASSCRFDAFVLHTGKDKDALRRILPDLRDQTHLANAPILAVYPERLPQMAVDALALGATAVVADTAGLEELEFRIAHALARKALDDALRRSDEQSHRMAATDALTGLYNRRYVESYLASLAEQHDGIRAEFSLVLVDLDHFKGINDRYGHAAGDAVLCEVAQCLQDNLRVRDLVARFGGEEFLVVLPETSRATALLLAERLRRAVASRPICIPNVGKVPVTASMGVATADQNPRRERGLERLGTPDIGFGSAFQTVFDAADAALYRAKSAGRDRVEVSAA